MSENDEKRKRLENAYRNYYKSFLIRAYYTLNKDRNLAEDVVQEAFQRLIEKGGIPDKIPDNKIRTYVCAVVHNTAVDYIRKKGGRRKVYKTKEISLDDDKDGKKLRDIMPDKSVRYSRLESQEIWGVLPTRLRRILEMKILKDKKYFQIAEEIDMPLRNMFYLLKEEKSVARESLKRRGYYAA